MNKTAIKNFAVEARKKLIASVKDKAGRIGITKEDITEAISKGEGYAVFPTHIGIETTLVGKELKQRENLVNRIKEKGYESVMEEVAYTWFNRIIAVRFMEVNDYLPSRIRVLSSETKRKFEPDIVTQAPKIDLELTDQEIEEIISFKEKNELDKLFRLLFIKQCNDLGEILPELFESTSKYNKDYTEILLDVSYTNEDGVIRDLLKIDEVDFLEAVEIIGWMYQHYNTEMNEMVYNGKMSKDKIPKELLPAATQLFTPDWPVRYMVENALGRLWLERQPSSSLKSEWKFYLDELGQETNVAQLENILAGNNNVNPEDIKIIDPCMGSGHILVYAFDVLIQIYESCGYTGRDAAGLILQKNLYGLDIDDRAYQLAYFAVMMRARKYNRRIFDEDIKPNLCSIHESNDLYSFEQGASQLKLDELHKETAKYLINVFKDAKEYGSILKIENRNYDGLLAYIESYEPEGIEDLFTSAWLNNILSTVPQLIKQAKIMAQKYNVVITNPPYLGNARMNPKLSGFIADNYSNEKTDFSMVMYKKAINDFSENDGYIAFVTTTSWMFLKSFEAIRKYALNNLEFESLVDFGTELFDGKVGHNPIVAWVNKNCKPSKAMVAIRLVDYCYSRREEKIVEFFKTRNRYISKQDNYSKIPGMPIAYWMSERLIEKFKYPLINTILNTRVGLDTGNNDKYLRLWYEIDNSKIAFGKESIEEVHGHDGYKWVPHTKGGAYRKWYGNNEYVIAFDIKNYNLLLNSGNHLPSRQFYFLEGITWSRISSTKFSVRYSPEGMIFNSACPTGFAKKRHLRICLALLNSVIAKCYLSVISPTMNFQAGDINKIPFILNGNMSNIINILVENNIIISKTDWNCFETSWDFIRHPLIIHRVKSNSIKSIYIKWDDFTKKQLYELKSNEEELNCIFIEMYGLQNELTPEVEDKDVTIHKADLQKDIRSFVSYAVGCMFGRYSLDLEGLTYAGGQWDDGIYTSFIPNKDNIIPITDEEYFDDDIISRFVNFVKVVYGEDILEENLEFIAGALGNKGSTSREVIRNYFLKDFYKDHVKTYQKRPIYWLFDSGKENGFKALIYLHRYNEDTVGRVRADYLHKTQSAIENTIAHCDVVLESNAPASDKAKAVKQKGKLVKQFAETRIYDQAIAHIAHQRIPLDLDDGVVANYAKFQGIEVASEGKKSVTVDLLGKI